ncbi:MAG: YchF/TatD family DNA exonuclease [bacterium]|nr:YchF/TatD family DNA exonuclease [bacterium]
MLIDSHAHLYFDGFDVDRDEVIRRAASEDVKYVINIGIDIETSYRSLQLAKEYEGVFASAGVHPNDALKYDENAGQEIETLLKEEKIIAVGEIGLDYYRDRAPKDVQIRAFSEQLKIARDNDVPVIIHIRDAWEDAEEVIEKAVGWDVRGVFHCYSGDQETAQRLTRKKFLISLGGYITYNNYKGDAMLVEIPIEKMLIETDSPFLTPMPFRGKRNEPSYVKFVAQRLADLKGLSLEDVGRITSFNANRLFGIAPEMEEPKIVYQIRDSLYINPTLRCTSDCVFCSRLTDPVVKGHNLKITEEPTAEEAIRAIGDPKNYKEIVFCGYGEPTLRLEFVKEVASQIREYGVPIRLNTNGHGNLIHSRNIAAELAGLIDEISVSLNTHDAEHYQKIMRTEYGTSSFNAMLDFIKKTNEAGIKAVVSVVDIPGLDKKKIGKLADRTGAELKVRKYNEVG